MYVVMAHEQAAFPGSVLCIIHGYLTLFYWYRMLNSCTSATSTNMIIALWP
jgi:hypothetical protein